jgi:hypothetical protein
MRGETGITLVQSKFNNFFCEKKSNKKSKQMAAKTRSHARTIPRPRIRNDASLAPVRGKYRNYAAAGVMWSHCMNELLTQLAYDRPQNDPYLYTTQHICLLVCYVQYCLS